ncbi:MAG: protein translocase subunit SecF, partial [Ruminococcaceae bacterium]|nr:protein translocase subunit SecF [Oscillospiraceae bacterium]
AIALAIILMLLYITFRFDFQSGTSAVLALAHDVIIMLGFYSLFQFTVSTSFIAAILTIVGYSINATIIVFDRVRENNRLMRKATPDEVADNAIKSSYYRAINSSVTTLLTIGVLYVMGVDSIREFALPIIVGIIAGTYSSLFIAGPFWAWWKSADKKKA